MVVNNDIINVNSFFIYLYVDLSENYFKIYLLLITYIYCCVLNECSSITNSFESILCVCIRYIHNIAGHGFCCYNSG